MGTVLRMVKGWGLTNSGRREREGARFQFGTKVKSEGHWGEGCVMSTGIFPKKRDAKGSVNPAIV